jgi:hypothetical protein
VACGKCEKLLKKKKKVVKIFSDGNFLEVGLRPKKKKVAKYSGPPPETNFSLRPLGGGGAKFISSPWAQKWLATALVIRYLSFLKSHRCKKRFLRFLFFYKKRVF